MLNFNESQIKAIKSLSNTIVIAGAGSGKTTTIIGKVEYLIKHKLYKPEEILIISFTNETVNDLKKRMKYPVNTKTFHKLAVDIINNQNKRIIQNNYLAYIINEYFNSYALYHPKTYKLFKTIIKNQNLDLLNILIETFINIYKSNYYDINKLFSLYKKSIFIDKIYYKFILDIYLIYQRELESTNSMDFNDLIAQATNLINNNQRKTSYKYIIIDEFQDTSQMRLDLIKGILNQNNGHFFVVGDDYQSIYRFSGCNLDLFINFSNEFLDTKILFLNHNYRNSTNLIKIANSFVTKNKKQIKKDAICQHNLNKPIKIIFYVDKLSVIHKVSKMIKGKILILGRYNHDKEKFNVKENDNIRFLTIHKAKGLEEDNVVVINLENTTFGFPAKIKNEKILSTVLKTDYVIHEEERRLFYVALTRARKYVYLLVPKNSYSVFIKELIHYYKKDLDIICID